MDNPEIMEMLKLILEKVDRLEKLNAKNVTIESGEITINCESSSSVTIDSAESVIIQGSTIPISVDNADDFSVHSSGGTVTVTNNTEE